MQHQSSARAAQATTSAERVNEILDKIEGEVDRLYRQRPQLKERIKKASHILVAHLAGRPHTPVVKIRVTHSGKRRRFLFNSLTNSGETYTVLPVSWSCSCPDHHRRDAACKHSIAAWTLWKVAQPDRTAGTVIPREPDGCPCDHGILRITREMVHSETGEIQERVVSEPCRRCRGGAA